MCQKHQSQSVQSSLSCSTAFFNSLARSRYLSFFSHSFRFILWSARTAKSTILQFLFFLLLIIIRSGLLAEIRWSVCMSKSDIIIIIIIIVVIVIIIIIILFLWKFFTPALDDTFPLETEWQQVFSVFRNLPSILADFSHAVVSRDSTCLFISKSSNPFAYRLVIVQSELITNGITVTFVFHRSLVIWQGLGTYLFFPLSLIITLWWLGLERPLFGKFSFFVNYHYFSKSKRSFSVSFSWTGFCFVLIPSGDMVEFKFFARFPVDYLSHEVCVNLLQSLVM